MNENAGPYQGMESMDCRFTAVQDLEAQSLWKTEPYSHNVGTCYVVVQRCIHGVSPVVCPYNHWQNRP